MFHEKQFQLLTCTATLLTLLSPIPDAQVVDLVGYFKPFVGLASTTQFYVGPEMGGGTSCGVSGWHYGINAGNPVAGKGPGFLYAAVNQMMFSTNPSDVNDYGLHFHFDIAVDATNQEQYDRFFAGENDGSDWKNIAFIKASCDGITNPDLPIKE